MAQPDPPDRGPLILRPHRIGDLGWMIHRQGILYNRQFGWNGKFETLIARIYGGYETLPAPKDLWVAEQERSVRRVTHDSLPAAIGMAMEGTTVSELFAEQPEIGRLQPVIQLANEGLPQFLDHLRKVVAPAG